MRNDLTDITLVVDRSGSMRSIQADAEGGINSFLEKQAQLDGESLTTIVQFDTEYEFVVKGVPTGDVEPYKLYPRGMTALLDAIGRAINETGERIAKMPEPERPGLVVFVVMTDGMENSSVEFSNEKIREMIEHQQDTYDWQFTFLGADQDAIGEASKMGMRAGGHASFAKHKVAAAYGYAGDKLARMRALKMAGKEVVNEFTDEEIEDMKD